jgi:site-specific recombinase XerC
MKSAAGTWVAAQRATRHGVLTEMANWRRLRLTDATLHDCLRPIHLMDTTAGCAWAESPFVFCTPIGTPVDPRNATRDFDAMRREAQLTTTRFHDLRHTAATLLLVMGVDPRTIMQTLGHSQISLTLNTYAHVLPSLQAEAAAKMNAIFSGE